MKTRVLFLTLVFASLCAWGAEDADDEKQAIVHLSDRYVLYPGAMQLSGQETLMDIFMTLPDIFTVDATELVSLDNNGKGIADQFGIVGILPIGMSQISSVNFEPNLHAGVTVKKGDPMGWFDFGGSDIVLLFQKDIDVKMFAKELQDGTYPHAYTGNEFAKLTKK